MKLNSCELGRRIKAWLWRGSVVMSQFVYEICYRCEGKRFDYSHLRLEQRT